MVDSYFELSFNFLKILLISSRIRIMLGNYDNDDLQFNTLDFQ